MRIWVVEIGVSLEHGAESRRGEGKGRGKEAHGKERPLAEMSTAGATLLFSQSKTPPVLHRTVSS